MGHSTIDTTIQRDVNRLLCNLSETYDSRHGIGTMTCSVYDTAWVANVCKTVSGVRQYLFPSSFLAILNAQTQDGSWSGHFDAPNGASKGASSNLADRLLSTMAALYTLVLHQQSPLQIDPDRIPGPSMESRIQLASNSLQTLLNLWRLEDSNAVGFEVLAPGLLDVLSQNGLVFDFPGKPVLFKIRDKKLARLSPEIMYKMAPSALLHSLEAFHGWSIDRFDVSRIKHHMVGGSMMASPSATASYLMKSVEWDDDAETYLRTAIQYGEGQGSGCVPSAFPSTNFEILWVVSTLAEFNVCDFPTTTERLHILNDALGDMRTATNGLVGFAPGIEPDLDDSAKASIIATLSGDPSFSETIVRAFDAPTHLKTYHGERNPSVSANCNALMSLLVDKSDFAGKSETIRKIVAFICKSWTDGNGVIEEKWNLSPYYLSMLISHSLAKVLVQWRSGDLSDVSDDLVVLQIVPILLRCLSQLLDGQSPNGSWGSIGVYEETAYASLGLISLLNLPLPQSLARKTALAIEKGREFLLTRGDTPCEFLWIEKITYGSQNLMDAYVLAALHAPLHPSHGKRLDTKLAGHQVELGEMMQVQGEGERVVIF